MIKSIVFFATTKTRPPGCMVLISWSGGVEYAGFGAAKAPFVSVARCNSGKQWDVKCGDPTTCWASHHIPIG